MPTFKQGDRDSYQVTTETRQVRDVSDRIFRYNEHSLLYLKGGVGIGPDGKKTTAQQRIKTRKTGSFKVEWQEKDVFNQPNLTTTGTMSSSGTTLTLATADANVRISDIYRVNSESVVITAITSTTEFTVSRAAGTADTIGTAATLKYIGNANLEDASIRASRSGDFNMLDNNCMTIRTPISQTEIEAEIAKYEDQSSESELILEGMIQHHTELETMILFGNKALGSATVRAMMGGLHEYLTTNVYSSTSGGYKAIESNSAPSWSGGAGHGTAGMTYDSFIEEFAPLIFRYNDQNRKRKRVVVGGHIIPIMWKEWIKDNGTVYLDQLQDEMGFGVPIVRTPFGIYEYACSQSGERIEPGWAYVIDPSLIEWRPLGGLDTKLLKGRQANDVTIFKHELKTVGTVQVYGERSMGIIKNLVRGTL